MLQSKGYTKRSIPTFLQVKRYLKKEAKVQKKDLNDVNASNALAMMKKYSPLDW